MARVVHHLLVRCTILIVGVAARCTRTWHVSIFYLGATCYLFFSDLSVGPLVISSRQILSPQVLMLLQRQPALRNHSIIDFGPQIHLFKLPLLALIIKSPRLRALAFLLFSDSCLRIEDI